MTGNRILFTSYKAYDGGHVVFGNNLKGKVIGGGNITHDSITITNVEHPKSSPLIEDDRINEPIVHDLNGSPSLQVNISDESYSKSVKEATGDALTKGWVVINVEVIEERLARHCWVEYDLELFDLVGEVGEVGLAIFGECGGEMLGERGGEGEDMMDEEGWERKKDPENVCLNKVIPAGTSIGMVKDAEKEENSKKFRDPAGGGPKNTGRS
ncbi:hypothetical protein Tco_1400836 [Tanacetum coccineum]